MGKWSFTQYSKTPTGEIALVELSKKQKTRQGEYTKMLEVAAASVVANPQFSKYFVKESIGAVGGDILPAGNIEYGLCQALHGEESAVAAFRSHYGRKKTKNLVLGIIAGNPGNIATPCGNCRDIMLEDLGRDFEIVSGAADGGVAVVANMEQYLFENYEQLPLPVEPMLYEKSWHAIVMGESLVNDAYSPLLVRPERRYHAMIMTERNDFCGARDVMCEYHPIYALRDAIRQARRANDPFIEAVIIVCGDLGGMPPHVMYKDRQHLVELNLQQELLSGKEKNPPVYLFTYRNAVEITGVWKTSVKEWIPMVFTPRNFGEEFVKYLTTYFKSKISP
ncbi:MAG: hypothetical protein Q7S52_00020 [bacterium]|nr:hypothetical protein [bacterium]